MNTKILFRQIEKLIFSFSDRIIMPGIIFFMFLAACNQSQETDEDTIVRSDVMVIYPVEKDTSVFKEYQGITQFTEHLQIRALSTGIISKSLVSVSSRIENNKPLFVIKSREASILSASTPQNSILSGMADTVFSFSSGIIDQVLVQQGDYVQEGDLLATCVKENSMRILVSVPLEENITNFHNKSCEIILPDNKILQGTIGASLPVVNINNQTNQFLVNPVSVNGLAENMYVVVRIKKQSVKNGMFIPKSSVYSNEELTDHWVCLVTQDTIVKTIPVNTGIEIDTLIQIINSPLHFNDQIIYKGGYGLSDSALVNIIQKEK